MKPLFVVGVSALLLLCTACKSTHLASFNPAGAGPLAKTTAPATTPPKKDKDDDQPAHEGGFGAFDDPTKKSVGNSLDAPSDASASKNPDGGKSASASATTAPPTTATPAPDGTATTADADKAATDKAAADLAAANNAASDKNGANAAADSKLDQDDANGPIDGSDPSIGNPSTPPHRKLI